MHSDEWLVHNARNGDEEAFVALFKLHFRMVKSVAYQIVRDEHVAQDLAQEVFIKAYLKRGSLVNVDNVESWLYTITKRKAIDWLRYEKRQPFTLNVQAGDPVDPFLIEDGYICKEITMLVRDALLQLNQPHRAAVILHDLHGFTAKEISSMTQMSTNTIESRIRRARLKLKKILAPAKVNPIMVSVKTPWIVRQPSILVHNQEIEMRLVNNSILAVMLHLRRLAG